MRITHLPTGIVVECQDDRSQHRNSDKAHEGAGRAHQGQGTARAPGQGSRARARAWSARGDRSERIRTYNFPQGRITDHRINLTLYKLQHVLDGDLDDLISALASEHQAELLAALGED